MRRLRPATADAGFIGRLMLFLTLAVVSGLLAAGLVLPVTGGIGYLADSTVDSFESLPTELETPPLPQRSRILDADGKVFATFYFENRVTVPLSEVAPMMRQAIVDIEDSRFYEHGALDLRGTLRAFVSNQTSESVQGGSTLTQQYVKNVLVEAAHAAGDKAAAAEAKAVDYGRKMRELRYAIGLEEKLTKDEILERYLNIAYFGSGAYGVEAAARHYFSKAASALTLAEAATLAGIVRSPVSYDPTRNPELSQTRRDTVLARMLELGHISAAEAKQAQAAKLGLKVQKTANGCAVATYPFFCDYVQRTILTDPQFGETAEDRAQLLRRGGLTIRTTLRPAAQKAAQKAVDDHVKATDRVASAIAMLEPGTGEVVALAQSRDYGKGKGKTTVNYAVDKLYGASGGFPAGSAFKPFVAAAAIKQGIPLDFPIRAPYQVHINQTMRTCDGKRLVDDWPVRNELRSENGVFTLATGMAKSVNTYFAQLEVKTGVCDPWKVATALGLTQSDGSPLHQLKSFTLGVDEVSPLAMAEAYATFAARGIHCEAEVITEVVDSTGAVLVAPKPQCKRALETEVADAVNYLLQGVMKPGGTGARLGLGRPAAGKTGTAERLAVWYAGYTPELAAAVWAGDPDSLSYRLANITIGGKRYGNVCGGCLPGPIWQQAMRGALKGVTASRFVAPDPKIVNGVGVEVPSLVGLSPAEAADVLANLGLLATIGDPFDTDAVVAGAVADTTPLAGTKANSGDTITLLISTGKAPAPVLPPELPPVQADPSAPPPDQAPQASNGRHRGNGRGHGHG